MFMRTKIVNGKEYKSWESRKRVNGKVVSIYHGSANGPMPGERAAAIAMAKVDAYQRATFGETGAELKAREAEAGKFNQNAYLAATVASPVANTTDQSPNNEAQTNNSGVSENGKDVSEDSHSGDVNGGDG